MSTSPTLEAVVKQSDERSPQLDLPPPPLPSASSSPSKVPPPPLPPSSFIWPFSDPSLVFYIDEFSAKAESLRKNLERRATASGLLFRITTAPTEASHVVLDSNCNDNASLRSLAPPQHVVSLDWLKDSFFEEKGLEEEEYSLRIEQGTEQAEEAEGEEDEDEDAFVGLPAYASHAKGSWIVKEEKEFIRFLASDPQRDAEGRSIFRQYQSSHPSRTVPAYNSYYFKRKDVLDAKVAKLKAASNGQPIVYEHPKIVQEELDEKSVGGKENEDAPVPFVKTRADPTRASPTPPSVPKASKSQCPRRACSNCDVHQATSWHRIKGRDECWFCRSCYDCWRRANQTNPGSEDRALARKRRPVLGERAVDSSDLSELEDSTSDASSDSDDSQSRSSSSSEHAVLPKSFRSEKRRGREKAKEWTKEEEDDLVRLLARRKGSLAQVWRSFSVQHPRRSSESTRKRHGTHRARFNQKVAAFQRKEGKKSTRPAAVSESEELEDDESMGGEEEAEESSHPKTSTSISSPKRYAVDRKRPQEPEAESSKRRRVEAPFTAVASSSHPSSSNHHHHYPQQQQHSSFPSTSSSGFASGSNYSLNQPRPPLPSFSRRVAS
ncbi:hypothetical protein BDY24DRAFT_403693, partial [Mrakia frigida]|uniref:uncharacterized protein n=1 Tax=Mrakia frigida TaxID=29902 RepID=UPI003FCC1943